MEKIVEISILLGYMKVPEGVLINLDNIKKYRPDQVVIITTGSQGEPMSALTRMAYSDHRKVEVTKDDLIIISASPIPGNEKPISNVINELFKIGAEVIYKSLMDIHVSGHACQEELKLMLSLTKPKFFIPVHGEHRHLVLHKRIAEQVGIPPENSFVLSNGTVLELDANSAKVNGTIPAGQVLVDGLGVGDVGNIVLRDRKHLAQDGLIIIVITIDHETQSIASRPDVISRGFVYVREAEQLIDGVKDTVQESVEECLSRRNVDWAMMKNTVKSGVARYIFERTKRNPMILPIIEEV
jgi:ribonuclease J